MNNVSLVGRLTADVDLNITPSGVSVCSFTLAVKRPNVKDTTDFIKCVAWRGTAEIISKFFSKGSMLSLTGVLTSRKFEDKNGNTHVVYEVVANTVGFCESKRETVNDEQQPKYEEIPTDDDLPFN